MEKDQTLRALCRGNGGHSLTIPVSSMKPELAMSGCSSGVRYWDRDHEDGVGGWECDCLLGIVLKKCMRLTVTGRRANPTHAAGSPLSS